MKKTMGEFKTFIARGNVVDLAVGIIIGGAFGKIVASLVNDIIMPIVSLVFRSNFNDWKYVISPAEGDVAEVAIRFGAFIQTFIDFVIIAFVVFLMVKAINRMRKKQEEAPKAPPAPSKEEVLLTEIRDLLKK